MISKTELKALTLLRSAPLTADMETKHLKKLASLAREVEFSTDKIIYRKGELGRALYLIEEGEVVIEAEVVGQDYVPTDRLGPGEFFGWSSLFPPARKLGQTRAVKPTRSMAFDAEGVRLAMGIVGGLLIGLHLWLVTRRQEMSLVGELSAVFGLALGASLAYYVAGDRLDSTAILLGVINTLYFGGTVFYIKLKVRRQSRLAVPAHLSQRFLEAKACLGYQTLALSLIILLATLRLAPLLIPLALVPATCKVLLGAWHWQDKKSLSLVRLGLVEMLHSAAFAGLVIWAFSLDQRL